MGGLIDVYKKTLASDGIGGLYRGFVISCVGIFIYRGLYFGLYDTLKPVLLGDNPNATLSSFLGWAITIVSGLASYPIDTVRRRMMMTSGGGVKYNGSIDCARQVISNEGFMSLMKGAGANILRGVAGAGVLAGFDKFQAMYIPGGPPRPKKASTTLVDHPPKYLWLVPWRTERKELVLNIHHHVYKSVEPSASITLN